MSEPDIAVAKVKKSKPFKVERVGKQIRVCRYYRVKRPAKKKVAEEQKI